MGIITNKVKKDDIKEGDHIYTYRAAFTYSHHGIFVGSNKVVHFSPELTESSSTLASLFTFSGMSNISASCPTFGVSGMSNISASCPTSGVSESSFSCPTSVSYPTSYPDCGFRQPDSGVVITCLDCFLQNGSSYRFEYGVGNALLLARVRGGTCTTAASDPPQIVIHRAMYLLLQNGFGKYSVLKNNCEDFALYCKTGLLKRGGLGGGSSGQASDIIWFTLSTCVPGIAKYIGGPAGVATVTVGMYCMNRYATDIGVRTDVTKVAVEDVAVKPVGLDSNGLKENKASD